MIPRFDQIADVLERFVLFNNVLCQLRFIAWNAQLPLLLINVTKPFVLAITVTSEEYIHSSCFVLNLRHVMPNTVVCISSPARGFSDVFVSQGSGFRKGGRRERERESERERVSEWVSELDTWWDLYLCVWFSTVEIERVILCACDPGTLALLVSNRPKCRHCSRRRTTRLNANCPMHIAHIAVWFIELWLLGHHALAGVL